MQDIFVLHFVLHNGEKERFWEKKQQETGL